MRMKKEVSNKDVLQAVTTLHKNVGVLSERIDNLAQDLRSEIRATVDEAKEELLDEIRPIARAVDKDAVMLLNHERRIARIEKLVRK